MFVYDGGNYTTIDPSPPGISVGIQAYAINNAGEIAGYYSGGNCTERNCGFLYSSGIFATVTYSSPVSITNAYAINNNGANGLSFLATPSQYITFEPLGNQAFGAAPFTVAAAASSGLTVSFNPQNPRVCAVSGATVTLEAVGRCAILANQRGNARYAAATPIAQSFTVMHGSQTIAFGALSNQTFGSAPFTVAATARSGLTVRFSSLTPRVCAISGTTVTLLAAGACTIQARQPGNAGYAAAAPVNEGFQVTQDPGCSRGKTNGQAGGGRRANH